MSDDFNRNTQNEDENQRDPRNSRVFQEPSQDGKQRPEPPVSGRPNGTQNQAPRTNDMNLKHQVRIGSVMFAIDNDDAVEFKSARNYNIAAQIVALVSLIIGGVFASTVALILAIISYRKFLGIAGHMQDESVVRALKRAGMMAIVMSCVALVLNVVSLIILMPMVMQFVQTGDYSALFGNGPLAGSGSTSTTWG